VPDADLILVGGRIWTLDPGRPSAGAVAVTGEYISAVGDADEVLAERGHRTTVVELKGRTILPGFYDAHQHQLYAGLARRQVDGRAASMDELCARVVEAARAGGPQAWVEGHGYDERQLAEGRHPTRFELDHAARSQPCFVTRTCGHAMVANSAALAVAGIDRDTPDPSGGLIERDPHTGEPTGLLRERAMELVRRVVPPASPATLKRAIREAASENLRHGITSLWEPSVEPDHVAAYLELADAGELQIRVTMAHKKVLRSGEDVPIPQGFRRGRLSLTAVKLFQDGAIGARTAAVSGSYVGDPENHGVLVWDQVELDQLATDIASAGLQISIHAIGDDAIRSALAAIEAAVSRSPAPRRRHRIEHCGLPLGNLPAELGRLGVVPVVQPSFLFFHGDTYLENLGPDRSEHLYPVRSLLEGCGTVAGSSDGPVVPDATPLRGIQSAMTRATASGRVLGPRESISLEEGIRLYTVMAARAAHEEHDKGVLAPGKLADIAVLDRNLERVPTAELLEVGVEWVLVGGSTAFHA